MSNLLYRPAIDPAVASLAERALGRRIEAWTPVPNRIAGPETRWRVALEGSGSAFVKASWSEESADWLRTEHAVYTSLAASPFMPRLEGWGDEGGLAVLVLEDLSDATWPPPWTPALVESVRETLGEVAAATPPAGLPRLADSYFLATGWRDVAADPAPFLALGLCDAAWLESALPALQAAADAAELDGDALLHVDVRSDNLCLRGDRTLLFDWNQASIGNPLFDVVEWLPSLAAEGGPPPGEVLRDEDAAELAALLAGFFAARAGLPPPPRVPRLRELQLLQLRVALPWAAEALGLPPP